MLGKESAQNYDVVIIGAGPAGSVAGANLAQKGHRVLILEREIFPRFSIGESLLPQCMEFLEEAGMIDAVHQYGFQLKNGAIFERAGEQFTFNFSEKFTPGHSTTYEVVRADFDKLLADQAESCGVEIQYGREIKELQISNEGVFINAINKNSSKQKISAQFCLDASGFGRVLPRLLNLDKPSDFPSRKSIFTHIKDNMHASIYDREKILITAHPKKPNVWFWLIPFSNGTSSIGAVAQEEFFNSYKGDSQHQLQEIIAEVPNLSHLLNKAEYCAQTRVIAGYASNVSSLHGKRFALLGNAGEFLDPIFSSGVTIALKSASLASTALHRQLCGEEVDWEKEFSEPLSNGVAVFKHFVHAWYDGSLQDIIFSFDANPKISC